MGNKYFMLLFGSFIIHIEATPSQVLLICHGEKAPGSKNINLSRRGCQRAYALVSLFTHTPLVPEYNLPKNVLQLDNGNYALPAAYGQPVALYAQGQKDSTHSMCSVMTLTPLAQKLMIEINHQTTENSYNKKNPNEYAEKYKHLIQDIINNGSYNNKIVLICWEPNAIPTIAQAFLKNYADGIALPKHLKKTKVFDTCDRIFRFTFKNGKITNFDNLAQELLFGDSPSSTNELYKIHDQKITRTK